MWTPILWNKLPTSRDHYVVTCIQYFSFCKEECSVDFRECQFCILPKQANVFQLQTAASRDSAHVNLWINVGQLGSKNESGSGTNLVCSVYAFHNNMSSPWAKPTHISSEILKFPPFLLVCGMLPGINLVKEWDNMILICGLIIVKPNKFGFYHLLPIADNFHYGKEDFLNGFYYEFYGTQLRFDIKIWEESKHQTSYCRSWIEQAYYSIRPCDNHKSLSCIYVADVNERSHMIFKSDASNKAFEQIACNPFNDVVAFTEKSPSSYVLYVYHTTNGQVKKINHEQSCHNFFTSTGGIGSGAISINWSSNGSVVVIGSNSEVWALHLQYNHTCQASYINTLPLGEKDSIRQVKVDWHNIYWLTKDGTIKVQDRWNGSMAVRMSKFWYDKSTGGRLKEFRQVFGIETVFYSDKHVQPDLYIPLISKLQTVMISVKTVKFTSTFDWSSPLASLHPPLAVSIRYKHLLPGDSASCFNQQNVTQCQDIQKSTNKLTRNTTLTRYISNLKQNVTYFVEVQATIQQMGFSNMATKNTTFVSNYGAPYRRQTNFEPEKSITVVVAAILGLVLLAILILLVAFIFYWYFMSRIKPFLHLHSFNEDQLRLMRTLGEGFFGQVQEAFLMTSNGKEIHVAIKTLKGGEHQAEAKKAFLEEAVILNHLQHKNIIRIEGICLSSKQHMIALEYINGGNLTNYLKSPVEMRVLCKISVDVCRACTYLSRKGYIHRDVRAANVLVEVAEKDTNRNFKRAILTDFGLAKDLGVQLEPYKTAKPLFPLRHSAPECFDGLFSPASDVYMFGILLWEIFSQGDTPLKDVPIRDIREGKTRNIRPQRPPKCPDAFYELMQHCWVGDPASRPTFPRVLSSLIMIRQSIDFCPPHPPETEDVELRNLCVPASYY